MKKLIMSGVLGIMLIATMAFGQTTVPEVSYQWTAPTEGSPVIEYVIEYRENGGVWVVAGTATSLVYTFTNVFNYLAVYEVRVAGRDALLRQGVFSIPSDPYMPDLGVPGAPGKPLIIQM